MTGYLGKLSPAVGGGLGGLPGRSAVAKRTVSVASSGSPFEPVATIDDSAVDINTALYVGEGESQTWESNGVRVSPDKKTVLVIFTARVSNVYRDYIKIYDYAASGLSHRLTYYRNRESSECLTRGVFHGNGYYWNQYRDIYRLDLVSGVVDMLGSIPSAGVFDSGYAYTGLEVVSSIRMTIVDGRGYLVFPAFNGIYSDEMFGVFEFSLVDVSVLRSNNFGTLTGSYNWYQLSSTLVINAGNGMVNLFVGGRRRRGSSYKLLQGSVQLDLASFDLVSPVAVAEVSYNDGYVSGATLELVSERGAIVSSAGGYGQIGGSNTLANAIALDGTARAGSIQDQYEPVHSINIRGIVFDDSELGFYNIPNNISTFSNQSGRISRCLKNFSNILAYRVREYAVEKGGAQYIDGLLAPLIRIDSKKEELSMTSFGSLGLYGLGGYLGGGQYLMTYSDHNTNVGEYRKIYVGIAEAVA